MAATEFNLSGNHCVDENLSGGTFAGLRRKTGFYQETAERQDYFREGTNGGFILRF